jgi:hypothetical protein
MPNARTPKGVPPCGYCAHYVPCSGNNGTEGMCTRRTTIDKDGMLVYEVVKFNTPTGSRQWCPYGRREQ